MKLPENADDGALPLHQVLSVLRNGGARVMSVEDRTYISKDDILEVQIFTDPVRRRVIKALGRRYGIDFLQFYYTDTENIH